MHAPSSIAAATRSHWFATTWLLAASLFCWYPIAACDRYLQGEEELFPFCLLWRFFQQVSADFF